MDLPNTLIPLATAFGVALIHSCWIGALLYVVVRAVFPLLPSASARHHLAYGALLTLAATFGYTLYMVYDPTPVCENLLITTGWISGPAQPAMTAELSWSEWLAATVAAYAPWLSAIYLFGLLPAVMLLLKDQRRVHALSTTGLHSPPGVWAERLTDELDRHPVTRRVRCYLSDRAGEVMTLGFWSPVIVFPVALTAELTPAMAHTILLHEIAHLRHYDHWLNYPQQFLRAFFFFHPAAHALCRLIDREREHRCDDWVVARCNDRRTYASALVTVARSAHTPRNQLVMSATKTPFSDRIQRLFLGEDHQKDGKFAFSVLLVVLLGAGHLSYNSLGADAGAVDCLEEQNRSARAAWEEYLTLVHQPAETEPTPYQLRKRSDADAWVITPARKAATSPCRARKTVEDLPCIAAPERPESTDDRVLSKYRKAREKYRAARARTAFVPEDLLPKRPCVSTKAPAMPALEPEVGTVIPIGLDTTPAPKVNIILYPTLKSRTPEVAYFIDGVQVSGAEKNVIDPDRIASVTVYKKATDLPQLEVTGYAGAVMIQTRSKSAQDSLAAPR